MASFTAQEILDRAKVYVDDDHADQKSWITDAKWLAIFNAEYAILYKRWVRSGLMQPTISQSSFTTTTKVLTGCLAVIGVARDNGGSITMLQPAQPVVGRDAFWRSATEPTGPSVRWSAEGLGDGLTIILDPVPDDGATYIVRYVPTPTAKTALSDTIELPFGGDERLVLGMARRAHLKDSGASQLLERLIIEADTELGFSAGGVVNGPRVMRRGQNPYSTPTAGQWPGRHHWRFA